MYQQDGKPIHRVRTGWVVFCLLCGRDHSPVYNSRALVEDELRDLTGPFQTRSRGLFGTPLIDPEARWTVT